MKRALPLLILVVALLLVGAWWLGRDQPIEYVVVRGDTLSKIAARYEVEVEDLRTWNGIEGDLIEVGQVLRIHLGEVEEPAPVSTGSSRKRSAPRESSAPPSAAPSSPAARLPVPVAEDCIPFEPELGEEGMAAPGGLDGTQLRGPLNRVLPTALGCDYGDAVRLDLELELTVGCDGLVDQVTVVDDDGASAESLACLREVLMRADFPAHDIEGGMIFSYPVTVEP